MSVTLRWKIISTSETELSLHPNKVFNITPNPGLYSQFSIAPNYGVVPYLLSPTIVYHQVLARELKNAGWPIPEDRFPYTILTQDFHGKVNLQLRVFWPNILSMTVLLSDLHLSSDDVDVRGLIDLQRLERLAPIATIVKKTISLAKSLDQRSFDRSVNFRHKPGIHLSEALSSDEFRNLLDSNVSRYVGILIRNSQYDSMKINIPKHVLEKNSEINQKTSEELMLIDKQGLLYVTHNGDRQASGRTRFLKTHDLYEIAFVISTYLHDYRTFSRLSNEDFADFLVHKIRYWIEEPEIVFSDSVSNRHIWNLLVNELGLRNRYRLAIAGQSILDDLAEKSMVFDRLSVGWWDQVDFPQTLTEQVAQTKSIDLGFLGNDELKRVVIDDYQEARRSYASRAYKATMLFCGSIAEAILTDVLIQAAPSGIGANDLYKKSLGDLIELAESSALIRDRVLIQLLQPLRQYRNIIHPGVMVRKSLKPDASKARIALETLLLLIRELAKRKITGTP